MDLVKESMGTVRVPSRHDRVFKDECMFSFDTPESPAGLFTSLASWQSFGADFVDADSQKSGNRLYLKQVWKCVKPDRVDEELPQEECKPNPSKLGFGIEGGFDVEKEKYEKDVQNYLVVLPQYHTISLPNDDVPMIVSTAIEAILSHDGFARAAELATAWEEEDRKESKYAKELPQLSNSIKISPDPKTWRCAESGIAENLWLNLSTGHIGSGRKNWDGSGGTGAAINHYVETGKNYPLAVKLGTITADGADVFSYADDENDMVLDPYLAQHLAHWGITMQQQKKSEKTMTELQIELNSSYDFSRITESGSDLTPLHGPGYVGLRNLGNSCYMASAMQILFSIPEISSRYFTHANQIFTTAPSDPSEDLLTMTAKLGVGLLSSRYTKPTPVYERVAASSELRVTTPHADDAPGTVRPFIFKHLIGKGHPEFSSSRQQDASEFFQHFLDRISTAECAGVDRLLASGEQADAFVKTSALFTFQVEERIQDLQSGKVKYMTRPENVLSLTLSTDDATNKKQVDDFEEQSKKRPKIDNEAQEEPVQLQIPFTACLDRFVKPEEIDNFTSPETGSKGTATKRSKFRTFPEYLVVHLKRYYLGEDWIPKKLDACVPMPVELDLRDLRGTGPADGEVLLPEDADETAETAESVVPDAAIVSQLMSMGFSENGSKRAAIATKNASAEASMEWVFQHMEDSNFNDPIAPEQPTPPVSTDFSADAITSLTGMGFTDEHARAALTASGGSLERAADWLFSHTGDLESAVREALSSGEPDARQHTNNIEHIDGEGFYEIVGFASHLGKQTSSGHYVAHIKKEGRFVLFNDAKVAISKNAPLDLGFMYVYRRKKSA